MRAATSTLVAAVAVLTLVGDGGAAGPHAPAGPVTSHPPVLEIMVDGRAGSQSAGRDPRSLLGGLVNRFVKDPTDIGLAVRLVEAAQQAGRVDWLWSFAMASSRRLPTGATLFLLAEIEYGQRGYAAGRELGQAAHAALPDSPDVGISYAAALAGTGDLLGAYTVVSRWASSPADWSDLSEPTLRRLAVITSAVAPASLGELATTAWIRRSWSASAPSMRTRALAFASAVAVSLDMRATAIALGSESLTYAPHAAVASNSALAVMNAVDVGVFGAPLVSRVGGACPLIPAAAREARADCLLSTLELSREAGALDTAMKAYEILRRDQSEHPVLSIRIGMAAIPLLEMLGIYSEAARVAEDAAEAARTLGDDELGASFLVRLARARRLMGDYPGALAAAESARGLAPESTTLQERARAEASKARHRSVGDEIPDDGDRTAAEAADILEFSALSARVKSEAVTPRAVLGAAQRSLALEGAGEGAEALHESLRVIDMFDAMRREADLDLVSGAELNDVWQSVGRRALMLALAEGEPRLGLAVLERIRALPGERDGLDSAAPLMLAEDSPMVAYAVGPEQVWAVVAGRGDLALVKLPLATSTLRDRVALWRELAKGNAGPERWATLGRSLVADLLEPIEATGLLRGAEVLHIVPDDILHLLPFATLAADRPGGGSDYLLTQVPSIAALRRSLASRTPRGPLVGFGVGGGSGTLAEMQSIRRAGGVGIVGRRATETEWRRQAPAASAIHFGGHARPPSEFGGAAALLLRADAESDGALSITEILSAKLPGSTIVLLGCDTATRATEPGPAAYYGQAPSLGEAFLYAGARSVVGNLWPITEEDARLLATAFYGAGGPARGAAALEEARSILRRRFPDLPRRWAGAVWLGAAAPRMRVHGS